MIEMLLAEFLSGRWVTAKGDTFIQVEMFRRILLKAYSQSGILNILSWFGVDNVVKKNLENEIGLD